MQNKLQIGAAFYYYVCVLKCKVQIRDGNVAKTKLTFHITNPLLLFHFYFTLLLSEPEHHF